MHWCAITAPSEAAPSNFADPRPANPLAECGFHDATRRGGVVRFTLDARGRAQAKRLVSGGGSTRIS